MGIPTFTGDDVIFGTVVRMLIGIDMDIGMVNFMDLCVVFGARIAMSSGVDSGMGIGVCFVAGVRLRFWYGMCIESRAQMSK